MAALRGVNEQANPLASEDPELKKRQMAALEQMYQTAMQGGMDPQSRAALLQAQNQNAAAERGARGAIVQNAQARGVGGSGAEFLGTLANQQGSAARNSMAGTQAAGDARTRALQAMYQSQAGYGGVRGQDLNAAQAKSQVEQFNAQQRLRKGGMMAGAYSDQADRTASTFGGLGSAVGAGVGAYGSANGWFDPAKKKNPAGVIGIEP
jgi:hypothetical protein